jgi:RNA recognition motif-containing protein
MSINIYVGNLSFDTKEDELRALFEAYGPVQSVRVIYDQFTGRSRGFAFVEMEAREQGVQAIQELDSKDLGGRTLKINEAKPKTQNRDRRSRDSRW